MRKAFVTWTDGERQFCGVRSTNGLAVIDRDGNYYGEISDELSPWERICWSSEAEPLDAQWAIFVKPAEQ